ncbi:glycosyltransferase family 4 protein [Flavobacterium sp.]|uniref:glycosyltransferase family 4 protein n=1 Tax=Flavobacterium sp. TaxID=239 RepID=UPI00286BF7DF|nr:glycosyltransferase family 4 protein [Flavobacterium sp.]
MHICFIANEFPLPDISYGGIGTFLVSYSKILIENGHSVSIVGTVNSKKDIIEKKNGVEIFYFQQSKIKGLKWFFNSKKLSKKISIIHKNKPIDVIEAQEAGFAFIKTPIGIRKIIRMHGGHSFFAEFEGKKINFWKFFQEKKSFKKCDAVIATSEFVKTQTLKHINFEKKPQTVINNPILIDLFSPQDKSKIIFGSAVFAGTICEKKGIRQLCLAIPKIIEEFPEFHLYAYGRDWFFPDGRLYKDWLLDQLSESILKHVTFLKPVIYEELPNVYAKGEICIFPSHVEVQGLVAPEAMSMQKPVIFTKFGPGPETIDDEINGWLCDTKSSDNIADTVIKVFKMRKNFESIGKLARKKVINKFEPKIIYNQNISFYESIIK